MPTTPSQTYLNNLHDLQSEYATTKTIANTATLSLHGEVADIQTRIDGLYTQKTELEIKISQARQNNANDVANAMSNGVIGIQAQIDEQEHIKLARKNLANTTYQMEKLYNMLKDYDPSIGITGV